ncbi:spermidine synthase [Arcobacter lanthieri]|uniref:spermine/spermidine synthase domain-containing protein n=1 Tax=Aliarcobacter lanthieri TaxID=1355374 RepID=UPI001923B866|nr:spermidine synthase [Aliarcobacter lanthieri]MBL3519666.1 spermidine synthase [Aliarcobacter lanthieri]
MKDSNVFAEMMVHISLCTHQEAKNVLIIGAVDEDIKKEANKHSKVSNVEYGDLSFVDTKEDKSIDVIIFTDIKLDLKSLANISRVLKNDALITFATKAFSKDKDILIADLKLVGDKFWIAMPFRFGHNTSIIASKKYHPTADINLQRADLLDDLEYYSAEIHMASFVFPKKEHKELTGIVKR